MSEVRVDFPDGTFCYYNRELLQVIQIIRDMIRHDRDAVLLVTGMPGAGKTCFTTQVAKGTDETFDQSRVEWDGKKYMDNCENRMKKGGKHTAGVLDESRHDTAGDYAHKTENKEFLDYFSFNRQNNQLHFLLQPDFFDFRKNMAIRRSYGLLLVYQAANEEWEPGKGDPFSRGHFAFFNYQAKGRLYMKYKKEGMMPSITELPSDCKPSIVGTFNHRWMIDHAEYKVRKDHEKKVYLAKMKGNDKLLKKTPHGFARKTTVLKGILKHAPQLQGKEIAEILDTSPSVVTHYKKVLDGEADELEVALKDTEEHLILNSDAD